MPFVDAEIAGKDLVLMRFLDVMLYSRLGGGDVRVETPRMTDNPERLSAWVTKGEAEYRAEIARLKTALQVAEAARATQEPCALMLAAYMAFIRGVDIPETIEQARAVLVERTLKAEAQLEAGGTLQTALRQLIAQWRAQVVASDEGVAYTLAYCADHLAALLVADACPHGNRRGACSWCDLRDDGGLPEAQGADEEFVVHAFNSRTPYEPGDDRDIWCKECEYHRDHAIHALLPALEPTP